jgi:lipopolysaccharide heptosyltransferase II
MSRIRQALPIALPPGAAHPRVPGAAAAAYWGPDVKRLLCVRLDNLGDVLMTTPALHALRCAALGRHVTLLASPAGALAAPFLDDVDEVITYEAPWAKNGVLPDPASDRRMCDLLATGQFDAAVIFTVYSQNPLPAATLCHLAGIPRRLAHCRENPYGLLTDWVPETEPQDGIRHEVERQLRLVEHVGARTADDRMRFRVLAQDTLGCAAKLAALGLDSTEPFIVIHPGASAASRRYPTERFAAAAARLIEMLQCPVLVTGADGERDLAANVAHAHARAHDLSGRLTLGELGALLARATVLISNNSGPVHIASALGTPVVDLYALTNPQHTPWQTQHRLLFNDVDCRWCYRSDCPEGHHACLLGVEVESVVEAASQLWHERLGAGGLWSAEAIAS